jgi:hypothetical protein
MPPDTRLHPFALGDQSGMTKMAITPDPMGSTTLDVGLAAGTVYFPQIIDVEQRTIDELVDSGAIPPAQLIKIDVQGSELAVLRGGAKTIATYAEVLQLECWLYRSYGPNTPLLGEIIEFLDNLGFGVLDFIEPQRDESGKLYVLDVFFARSKSKLDYWKEFEKPRRPARKARLEKVRNWFDRHSKTIAVLLRN